MDNAGVDLAYGLPLLTGLAIAWGGVRFVAGKTRRQRAALRRQMQPTAHTKIGTGSGRVSPRSEMRATAAPVTVIDTITDSGDRKGRPDPASPHAPR